MMPEFPDAFLRPSDAYIYGKPGEWAIVIALEPFRLDDETVRTQIDLDAFPWGVGHPLELAGTSHEFSAGDRDESGVEGSMYLRHAHHPVDVSRISFAGAGGEALQATIECDFVFDFEGGRFNNRSARITCRIECREPDMTKGTVKSYRVIR
jgi:hypothetical protein